MALACVGVFASAAPPAFAEKLDCPTASEEAQRLRDKNRYLEARELFHRCSQTSCPSIVRKDCTKWLTELDEATPSIVIAAQDGAGADIADVKVELDGKVIATRVDGRPIPIDPGEHVLRAEADGQTPITQKLIARVNEKNRIIRVAFPAPPSSVTPPEPEKPPPPPPARPSESGRGVPAVSWILGGVGLVGLGGFAYFGLTGKSELADLRASCAPYCEQAQLDDVKSGMLVADISLGVGIVALGVAAVLAISHMSSSPATAASAAR